MIKVYYTPVYDLSGFLEPGSINYKLFVSERTLISGGGKSDFLKFTYPNAKINEHLYYLLTHKECFKGLFDPLEFFNLIYEQLELILNNLYSLDEVASYLYDGTKETRSNYFMLGCINYLICRLNKSDWMLPPYDYDKGNGLEVSFLLEDFLLTHLVGKIEDLYAVLSTDTSWICNLYEFLPNEYELRLGVKNKVPTQTKKEETRSEKLYKQFQQFGLFDLPRVDPLTGESKRRLIELIATKKMPYIIALFDHIGFISHLDKNHFKTKEKRNQKISEWFEADKEGRTVKGNINSLVNRTTKRYTAYQYQEQVQKDLNNLKKS